MKKFRICIEIEFINIRIGLIFIQKNGSSAKVGDYAKSLVNLKRKKVRSLTPRSCILKFLILALKDSAAALVLLWSK